ncbi:MAG: hypothetical protein HY360_11670 [Verrucomicrobia bacterium]|nr:hypothetical protein [Verrucomicrobiota bacterium]
MSAHAFTEDQLFEQPAIGLFAEQAAWPHPRLDPLPLGEEAAGAGVPRLLSGHTAHEN